MGLKVIGAGFGRTGTSSTQVALAQLGFPCYHMREILANPANKSHLDFWGRVARSPPGTRQDWSQLFEQYAATVDFPAASVWKELSEAYPDAKILLTLHPGGPEAWYESAMETIYRGEIMWEWKVFARLVPRVHRFRDMTHRLVWQRSLQGAMPDRARAVARYNAHVEEVRATVPPDRLLVYTVTEGWAPLCAFLGVTPPDIPFPDLNDRASFKRLHTTVRAAVIAGIIVVTAIVGILCFLARRHL